MKASELLTKLKEGEEIPCANCEGTIPADEMMNFAFKLGKLAPHMENAGVGTITCVQCQTDDPDIKITPRGPDVKFVRGD
ncbi:MAG: hypothetical protein OXD54_16255 [Candidatus Poribacteria bacterium]|nr:hypothetical protein [Candidatus Poribacteria bacterium]